MSTVIQIPTVFVGYHVVSWIDKVKLLVSRRDMVRCLHLSWAFLGVERRATLGRSRRGYRPYR